MRWIWATGALVVGFALTGPVATEESPLIQRGGIMGREFSEVGRLYVEDDALIHFRTDERLYYFSHMYYIWDALAAAEVVKGGKIIYDDPLRITGNYSKAQYVYNFLEEPALRGSQIMWIDRVDKVDTSNDEEEAFTSLFDGESLTDWSIAPTDSKAWKVEGKVLSGSATSANAASSLISEAAFTDFELAFEYRCSWQTSASILLRSNAKGEGIALSLDHIDEGTVGFPKSAVGASRPFMLYEIREERGVGAEAHLHLQYDGRLNDDAAAHESSLHPCDLREFLKEWDAASWNLVKIRCIGSKPEVLVWINGFLICRFNASRVPMSEANPSHLGAIEKYVVHPSGRIGFAVHSSKLDAPGLLLREIHVKALE